MTVTIEECLVIVGKSEWFVYYKCGINRYIVYMYVIL